jgi:hypothetical protein
MERRDYLKKQIDELGKALAKLLEKVLRTEGQIEIETEHYFKQSLSGQADISLEKIIRKFKEGNLETYTKEVRLSPDHQSLLAEIFFASAKQLEECNIDRAVECYQVALAFYESLNSVQSIFSLETQFKIQEIQSLLRELK